MREQAQETVGEIAFDRGVREKATNGTLVPWLPCHKLTRVWGRRERRQHIVVVVVP